MQKISRRSVLKSAGSVGLGSIALGISPLIGGNRALPLRKPNIVIITVDEMRFPMHFPTGVASHGDYLATVMPNLWHRLWRKGVEFTNHHTAATACSPSRASIVTGLYAQQHGQLTTIGALPTQPGAAIGPELPTSYPTYGKGLRQLGYQTWYYGKWHLSGPGSHPDAPVDGTTLTHFAGADYLDPYGFSGGTYPDPLGQTPVDGMAYDSQIVDGFQAWYARQKAAPSSQPWCVTVALLNPHDAQFFWDGQIERPFDQNAGAPEQWVPAYARSEVPYRHAARAANWEALSPQRPTHPPAHYVLKRAQDIINGVIADDAAAFTQRPIVPPITMSDGEPTPNAPTVETVAPDAYWQRCLDFYAHVQSQVDVQIGRILDTLAGEDAVIIFTADHGEYAGSHGLIGKGSSAYRESSQVPLVVYDPLGEYTAESGTARTGLTSHVDVLPLLMTIGNRGNGGWTALDAMYADLYRTRHNMYAMLKKPDAPGRQFILHTYDEPIGTDLDQAHLIAMRTASGTLGVYTTWNGALEADFATAICEYFESGAAGADPLELINVDGSAAAQQAKSLLLGTLLADELQRPLPLALRRDQARMLAAYDRFRTIFVDQILPQVVFTQVPWRTPAQPGEVEPSAISAPG